MTEKISDKLFSDDSYKLNIIYKVTIRNIINKSLKEKNNENEAVILIMLSTLYSLRCYLILIPKIIHNYYSLIPRGVQQFDF